MQSNYVDELLGDGAITEIEATVLNVVGNITSAERLYALVSSFPTLGMRGLDLAKLSNIAAKGSASSFMTSIKHVPGAPGTGTQPKAFGKGARHPRGVPGPVGYIVPMPAAAFGGVGGQQGSSTQPSRSSPTSTLSNAVTHYNATWPIRDQGLRGTCVAFAVAASYEHHQGSGSATDFSEQFLFWATKTYPGEPAPSSDGTWIEFAHQALTRVGVCVEALWVYNRNPQPGNTTQANNSNPSTNARAQAQAHQHSAQLYQQGGSALDVYNALHQHGAVAVSLPVFEDLLKPGNDNWNSGLGILYGEVLNPPPTAVVIGGHAVCVIGFAPDPSEPMGGYFLVRNSWGTNWGSALPSSGYHGPAPGYGQIPASYIDRWLWEFCVL